MQNQLSQAELAAKLGVAKSTISMYEVGKREPDFTTLKKITTLFHVDMNYLLGSPNISSQHSLTKKDERDIAKDLEIIMKKLSDRENGPASFDGTEISEADQEMFAAQVEIMLRRLKMINKEKYNPHKNNKSNISLKHHDIVNGSSSQKDPLLPTDTEGYHFSKENRINKK